MHQPLTQQTLLGCISPMHSHRGPQGHVQGCLSSCMWLQEGGDRASARIHGLHKDPKAHGSSPLLRSSGIILKMETPGKFSTSTSAYLCWVPRRVGRERTGEHTRGQAQELTKAWGFFLSTLSSKAADISRKQLKLLQEWISFWNSANEKQNPLNLLTGFLVE